MQRLKNLPYSNDKEPRLINEYGISRLTGMKTVARRYYEKEMGATEQEIENNKFGHLTTDEVIAIINQQQSEEFRQIFKDALNEIEDCLIESGLGAIEIKYTRLRYYKPFKDALDLKRKYFKELI